MPCHSRVLSLAFGLSFLLFAGCQDTRSLAGRALGWIPGMHGSQKAAALICEKTVRTHGLALTLRLEPVPVKLSETRRLEATLVLKNVSSRFIPLEFPTTQRFDLLVRDAAGKEVVQWSEDRAFEAEPGYVGINPGEHLQYNAAFSTRDLQPGKRYTVTAFFPTREDLKVELPLAPEK